MTTMSCAEFSDSAPELALGVLTGTERARALAHLEGCLSCRSRLDRLAEVSDALMEFVTPVEPPLGFDSRVAAKLAPAPAGRPALRWLAVAAVALLAGFAGWIGATASRSTPARPLVHAQLASAAGAAGQIYLYRADPSWVYMSVDTGAGDGPVTCLLEGAGGRVIHLGSFNLTSGYGYWGAPVPPGSGQIRGVRLVTATGALIASASLPAG